MLQNPYFWAGEIGLILAIVSGFVLTVQHQQDKLSVVGLLLLIVFGLYQLVHPVVYLPSHQIPVGAYLFRLAVGICSTIRMYRSFYPLGATILKVEFEQRKKILKWSAIGGLLILAGIYYKLKSFVSQ